MLSIELATEEVDVLLDSLLQLALILEQLSKLGEEGG
jgi:hypothetical protein